MSFDPSDRGDVLRMNLARDAEAMRLRIAAEQRAEASGLRNQRLAELTQALQGLNPDSWPGLDPTRAAVVVLPILESLVED